MADNLPGTVVGPAPSPADLPGKIVGPVPPTARPAVGQFDISGQFKQVTGGLQRDPSIDYGPGLGLDVEQAVKRADNPDEARLAIENRVQGGKASQDAAGNWYVETPDGRKTAVFGDQSGLPKRAVSTLRMLAPETAGMAAGSIAGGALGALGGPAAPVTVPIGAIVGGGLGGAAGKAVDEFYKHLTGGLSKTPEQERETLSKEGLLSAGGEAGVQGLSLLGRVAMKPSSIPWVHVDKAMEDLQAELKSRGMIPTIEQATGGKTYMLGMMHQKLTQYIWGDPEIKKNVAALNKQLLQKLSEAGVPPDRLDATLQAVIQRDIPRTAANEKIVQAITDYKNGLSKVADTASTNAKNILDQSFRDIDRDILDPKIELDAGLDSDITAARDAFRAQAGRMAQVVDELAGGRELVDTSPIKTEVQLVLDALPKTAGTAEKKVLAAPDERGIRHIETTPAAGGRPLGVTSETQTMAYIRDMKALPDKITLSDAQRIRSYLLELTRDPGLTPGIGIKELNQIRSGVDTSIDGINAIDPSVVSAFRSFNDFYRTTITKFEDVMANRLVKEAGERGAVEPEKVLDIIVRNNKVSQANRIMDFMSPTTKQQLSRDYFQDIINRSLNPGDPNTILGRRFLNIVTKEQPMIDAIMGKDTYTRLHQWAENAADFEDKLPYTNLSPNSVGLYIQTAKAARDARDKFMDTHFLAALSQEGALKDEALNFIAQPGRTDRLKQALALPNADTTIKPVVKEKVMSDILSHSIALSKMRPGEQIFSGGELKNEINRYGREYLTELYGKDTTDDLYRLGDVVDIMSKEYGTRSVGFVAGASIMLHPFKGTHLSVLVHTLIANEIMGTHRFIEWLIRGYEGDSIATRVAAEVSKNLVRVAEQNAMQKDVGSMVPGFVQRNVSQ